VVQADLLERELPIVGAIVDADDLELVFQQLDRRQDAVPMQAVRVQRIRVEVRGRDDADPVLEHRLQEAVQDHRVGDVGDVEFVEADQPISSRNALTEFLQRIHRAMKLREFAMHLAHELVKVQPRLAL